MFPTVVHWEGIMSAFNKVSHITKLFACTKDFLIMGVYCMWKSAALNRSITAPKNVKYMHRHIESIL